MKQKWALVTGADRGVGLALVKELLQEGYYVFAGQYLKEHEGWSSLSELQHSQLKIVPLDVSDSHSVSQALETVSAVTSKLDILINNAAILGDISSTIMDSINFEDIEQVFQVNTLGTLRMSNTFIHLIMGSDSKLIVNLSSEASSVGDNAWRTSWYAYCMSKAALNMQSRLIYNEISKQGGKVMVIHPGHVQTYMQGKLDSQGTLTSTESANNIMKRIMKKLGDSQDKNSLDFINFSGERLAW